MKQIIMIGMLFCSIVYGIVTSPSITVIDNKTKLEWQNQPINKTATSRWITAISYCEDLSLNNKNDWRLPNINELQSLIDSTKGSPVIASTLEETTNSNLSTGYWMITTYPKENDKAYILNFDEGLMESRSKDNTYYFRCVRDY